MNISAFSSASTPAEGDHPRLTEVAYERCYTVTAGANAKSRADDDGGAGPAVWFAERLTLEQIDVPQPQEEEVLVRVHAAGRTLGCAG